MSLHEFPEPGDVCQGPEAQIQSRRGPVCLLKLVSLNTPSKFHILPGQEAYVLNLRFREGSLSHGCSYTEQ